MTLKAITQTIPLVIDEAKQLMSTRAEVYIAAGDFSTEEIPTNFAALQALYSGATPKFKPFGEQQEEASDIEIDQETEKTHKRTRFKNFIIKANIKLHNFDEAMFAFLESPEFKEPVSLLIVPEDTPASAGDVSADTPANFFALSGITLSTKGKLPLNGNTATIEFTSEDKRKKLSNIIKIKQFTSAT